jgi:hypothetical protein
MRPDHRPAELAKALRQRVDMFDLPRIGLVGSLELVRPRVGALEVDVDQHRLLAVAEACTVRIRLDLGPDLAGGLVGHLHRTGSCQ